MNSFECEVCKTLIHDTSVGRITECEHYPFTELEPTPANKRSSFLQILAIYARDTNPVTKSVHRNILQDRINRTDLS